MNFVCALPFPYTVMLVNMNKFGKCRVENPF